MNFIKKMTIFFITVFVTINCRVMNYNLRNIKVINEKEFVQKMGDKDFVLIDSLLNKGTIVYKNKTSTIYYCLYNNNYFKIKPSAFDFFLQNIDSVTQEIGSEKKSVPTEMLYGINIYNSTFPEKTTILIEKLLSSNEININQKHSYDRMLLKAVDTKISILQDTEKFKKKYYLNLIALLGEVYINENPRAKWVMNLSSHDNETWYPILQDDGKKIALLGYMFDHFFDFGSTKLSNLEYCLNLMKFIAMQK